MDTTNPLVIFYRYDNSPFSDKIDKILILKNIPHIKVDVSWILPRSDLSELLGVSYRRIPILAIGNDVYCDTSLIAPVLERRFPASKGFGTIFPAIKGGRGAVDAGMQKVYSAFYCDRPLFRLAVGSMSWDRLPKEFLDDRRAMIGAPLDPQAMVDRRPVVHSQFSSHLDLAEEQLLDGREWLFDTETASLADVSLHFVLKFIKPFPGIKEIFNEQNYPKTFEWYSRLDRLLAQRAKEGSAAFHKISGKSAAEAIGAAEHEDARKVGFDETEGARLQLKVGCMISVTPDDSGRTHPTSGKLVGLNREEIVVETKGSTNATVRVHFPRLGFVVQEERASEQTKL